jgi:hypothetical protein
VLAKHRTAGTLIAQCGRAERGQALILWVLAATVILVIGAVVVDVGLWLTERRRAQLAADFAALAAATELHEPGGDPVGKGLEFAERNGFNDADPGVAVQVNANYAPDMVEVIIEQDAPMLFSSIFGAGVFEIGARAVGTDPVEDVDVVMIFDRTLSIETGSKTAQDLQNAKDGANAALEVLDPATRHVALGVIWASNSLSYPDSCAAGNVSWIPVPFSADYNDGSGNLNGSSLLVQTIDCLEISAGFGTNLEEPIRQAAAALQGGRSGARKAIILLLDTAPQQPSGSACRSAVNAANNAKAQGVEIYAIGFAVERDTCQFDSGSYGGEDTTRFLAEVATNSASDSSMSCWNPPRIASENGDGDHFFCQRRQDQLAPVFRMVAQALAREYRLEE